MMNQQHFFQGFPGFPGPGFFPPQEIIQPDPPYLQHNYVVQEITNNWPFARWLMCRHRENMLKQVDEMEKMWLDFLINNKIDIESYTGREQFLLQNSKKPEN